MEEIFETLIIEDFLNLMIDTKLQIQEAQDTMQDKQQKKKKKWRYVIFKLKKKENILRDSGGLGQGNTLPIEDKNYIRILFM